MQKFYLNFLYYTIKISKLQSKFLKHKTNDKSAENYFHENHFSPLLVKRIFCMILELVNIFITHFHHKSFSKIYLWRCCIYIPFRKCYWCEIELIMDLFINIWNICISKCFFFCLFKNQSRKWVFANKTTFSEMTTLMILYTTDVRFYSVVW